MGTNTSRRLTNATLAALAPGESAYDASLPGFLVRKNRRGRLDYFVRRRGKKHALHRAIGNSALMSLSDARERARTILVQHDHARMTAPGKRYTLDEGWPLYKASLLAAGRSPKTLRTYEMGMRRLSPKFRRTLLSDLGSDPSLFAAEHDRIAAGHPAAAAASGKLIAIIYGYIRERYDDTLPNRSPAIDRNVNTKPARDPRVLREGDMRDWWKRVQTLVDPVRREAHLMLVLSGMRPEALLAMRLEHQNTDDLTLWLIPNPKGGAIKQFSLILSPPMHECVKRVLAYALANGRANGHLFPATRGRGPLTMLAADRKTTWYEPRALRRGYATMAETVGVPERSIGRLLNHASSQPITALYVRTDPGGEMLRQQQAAISARIVAAIGDPALVDSTGDRIDDQTTAAWTEDAGLMPR